MDAIMDQQESIDDIIRDHEKLQHVLLRENRNIERNSHEKACTVESINELLRRIRSIYTIIDSSSDRILLFDIAETCHVNLRTILTETPKEPLPFPPPPSLPLPEPFSEKDLHGYVTHLDV